jgi:hypothetical protein
MKISDDQLNRFFREAGPTPGQAPMELSPALRWRIMADWRKTRPDSRGAGIARIFQLGFSFAFALMVVIAVLGYRQINQEQADEFTSPNALINLSIAE